MHDRDRPKEQLFAELAELRRRIAGLEQASQEKERRAEERAAELGEAIQRLQREAEKRKAVDETVLQSRDDLQTVYNEMVEGCLITDIETKRFVRVNPSICRMLGYSEEELLAASIPQIHPPEEVTNDLRRFQQVAESRRTINENRPVLRKDGTIFYADIAGNRILYNGRPCVLALFRDVTERRQAQEALRESEEKYKTLVETSPDAVIVADLTGHATFVSRRLLELQGAEHAEELLGKSAFDYLVPEEHQKGYTYFKKTLEEGITRDVEYTFIRKDGTRYPAELSASLVKDASGKPVAIISVLRDITERKQAEANLEQSRDELQAIYDSVVDGIIVVDADKMKPIRVNTAYTEMLGYSEEEAYDLSPERIHSSEVLPRVRTHFETVKNGHIARDDDVPFVHKDGRIVYADVVTSPMRYDGRPCCISFFHDVTERNRAEQALRKEQRSLKHLLQSSDHERQLIAYEIHDGLAQQLAGAIMQFETYLHRKDSKPKEAANAYDAAMTMLRQGHFEARRLISGVRPPILDESGVVAAIAHLVSDQSHLKGPKIDYHSRVDFDRLAATLENSIYRIVQEALTNACQHSKSEKVRISLLQREDRVQIEIRDWGIGFDAKSVYENRFGLMGIRQRARLLGGKCSIQSRAGKGTRIAVELPVVERE
jgi:PAS domain S-box-containing protein